LIVQWRNDPDESALFFASPPTLSDQLSWFRSPRHNRIDYAICEQDSDKTIGTINFKNIDLQERTAESGKLIGDKDARGKGYAKEASAAFYMYGFAQLSLNAIFVQTRADNHPNIHLNTRLGYEITDSFHDRAGDNEVHEFYRMRLYARVVLTNLFYRANDRHGFIEMLHNRLSIHEES